MNSSAVYKQNSRALFNSIADNYDSTTCGKHSSKIYPFVIGALNSSPYTTLLDIGCGTGNLLSQLPQDKNLYGIDLCVNMIEWAMKRLPPKVQLACGDSDHLPWGNGIFDVVTCTDSFYHYPDPQSVLCEMRRVTKYGGRLLIAEPATMAPFRQIVNFFMRFSKDGDVKIYGRHEFSHMLTNAGFTLKSFRVITATTWLLEATAS